MSAYHTGTLDICLACVRDTKWTNGLLWLGVCIPAVDAPIPFMIRPQFPSLMAVIAEPLAPAVGFLGFLGCFNSSRTENGSKGGSQKSPQKTSNSLTEAWEWGMSLWLWKL